VLFNCTNPYPNVCAAGTCLLIVQAVAGAPAATGGPFWMYADAREGTNAAHFVASDLPLFRKVQDCYGNPNHKLQRIHAKTQKGSHFKGFSLVLSLFLIFSITEITFEQMGLKQLYHGPFVYWEPFVPWLREAEQTQLLLESVGISGVCFPVSQFSRILVMKSQSPVAIFSSRIYWWGEGYNCLSCIALFGKAFSYYSQKSFGAFSVCQNFRALGDECCWIL